MSIKSLLIVYIVSVGAFLSYDLKRGSFSTMLFKFLSCFSSSRAFFVVDLSLRLLKMAEINTSSLILSLYDFFFVKVFYSIGFKSTFHFLASSFVAFHSSSIGISLTLIGLKFAFFVKFEK